MFWSRISELGYMAYTAVSRKVGYLC